MADAKFSIPKLNGTNWATWKLRVENLLARDDLWDVVVEEVPDEFDRDDDWEIANRKAKATLVLLLEDSQLAIVRKCVNAHDVFGALKAYHEKSTRSVRVSLLKKLCAINLSERGDLEQHLFEVDDLFDRLDAAGTTLDADTKICLLLRSLPPSFDGLVTALDSRSQDDITLEVVKSKLMDEFQRRLERDGHPVKKEKAMKTAVTKTGETRVCFYCKKPGHLQRNCRKLLEAKKEENNSSSSGTKPKKSDSESEK